MKITCLLIAIICGSCTSLAMQENGTVVTISRSDEKVMTELKSSHVYKLFTALNRIERAKFVFSTLQMGSVEKPNFVQKLLNDHKLIECFAKRLDEMEKNEPKTLLDLLLRVFEEKNLNSGLIPKNKEKIEIDVTKLEQLQIDEKPQEIKEG